MPTAIESFQATFFRANNQIAGSIHVHEMFNDLAERKGEPKKSYNDDLEATDMARFGIILGVAAMDDYFTRKYAEVLVPCLKAKGINPKFAEMLESAGFDLASALELVSMQRPYRRIRTIAQDYYRGYATHSTGRIDDLFATIGLSGLCAHAQRRAKRKNLIKSVELFVDRRHKIAHGGDLTRQGKLQPITLTLIKKLKDIDLFVKSADTHIDAYIKQKR